MDLAEYSDFEAIQLLAECHGAESPLSGQYSVLEALIERRLFTNNPAHDQALAAFVIYEALKCDDEDELLWASERAPFGFQAEIIKAVRQLLEEAINVPA